VKSSVSNKKYYLFHLGHPAHFHLFRHTIKSLINEGHKIAIAIKKKDILETLLENDALQYVNLLPGGRNNTKWGIFIGMLKTDYALLRFCLKNRPDLMIGTSYAISHVGKLLSIPSINLNEDDWDAVPFYAKFSYPWASVILAPSVCKTGKWEYKTIKYRGYHELAYLHPVRFKADINIASKYIDLSRPCYLVRFALLKAHHDKGVEGITNEFASNLFEVLRKTGNIYITSERPFPVEFEKYRLHINPLEIHHVMAFASLFIGDSQTMAAEAGILGVPFIRINDFAGKLGYLLDLEGKYNLGCCFKPVGYASILALINQWITNENLKPEWEMKRQKMLTDKIDVTSFLVWFIQNYPNSTKIMLGNPDFQLKFR
jgi:uncharacterized protein